MYGFLDQRSPQMAYNGNNGAYLRHYARTFVLQSGLVFASAGPTGPQPMHRSPQTAVPFLAMNHDAQQQKQIRVPHDSLLGVNLHDPMKRRTTSEEPAMNGNAYDVRAHSCPTPRREENFRAANYPFLAPSTLRVDQSADSGIVLRSR
eukprot:3195362-Rhodomonas_salina.1